MHGVLVDRAGEIGANGPRSGLRGVRRAHDLATPGDGPLALKHLDHDGTGSHELDEAFVEWPLPVDRVEPPCLRLRRVQHAGGDDSKSRFLETRVDGSDSVGGDRIRLDDRQCAFGGH